MAPRDTSALPTAGSFENEDYEDNDDPILDIDVEDQDDDAKVEAEARKSGWRPQAEYRGKPGGWLPAREFLERGETFAPFIQADRKRLREENERIVGEIGALRTTVEQQAADNAALRADMKKVLDWSRKANKAGYDKAVRDIEAQRREAVTAGDLETYDNLGEQLKAMEEVREESHPEETNQPPAQPQPRTPPGLKPEYTAFVEENPWAANDPILNPAIIAAHNAIMRKSPGMPLSEQLERAKAVVVSQYPDMFGEDANDDPPEEAPRRRPAAAPLAPRPGSAPRRGNREPSSINEIADPKERAQIRTAFNRMKQADPDLTEAEYLEIERDPHGDVLAVMAKRKKKG